MSTDVEALLVSFLRSRAEVVALAGDRVYTDLPHNPVYPLVRVVRTGGGSVYKDHLEAADIEVSSFGGTHRQAFTLAQTCQHAMANLRGSRPEGVVTRVRTTTLAYEPDPESTDKSGHARPRFVVHATVTVHP